MLHKDFYKRIKRIRRKLQTDFYKRIKLIRRKLLTDFYKRIRRIRRTLRADWVVLRPVRRLCGGDGFCGFYGWIV